jgi:uncharacterized protein DUF5681
MSANTDDEGTGYKRPPKSTQFKPGQTGNPKGRPKNVRNFKTDLCDELSERITVRENGLERKISKQRALVKALVAAAIKGDMRAANAIVTFSNKSFAGAEVTAPATDAATDDQDIIDAFVERELKRRRVTTRESIAPPKPKKGTH